ncbi:HDOD domain-containing protein [Seleniivibrio woodruffii]|uniref:HDOD domain-containing protein n=1 Tax=Seleniivibrio woodruffii TaxID=1078050 RepID=UPI00240A35E2|nr:HDOD domain-containing protein [Seleniivibrio woodruffii]
MNSTQGKILIVDDELNITNSLRRMFVCEGLDVLIANSAEEALDILSKNEAELILSDYKMPDVNGIQLLTTVKSQYPNVFRAILSGYVETDTITYAISKGIAMAYFKKPWTDYNLAEKIIHIIRTVRQVKNRDLVRIFSRMDKLPGIPEIYLRLERAIQAGESIEKIASIVKQDASMTAKIMQIGNSVFYSGKKYLPLEQAILMIGLNTIKEIVLMYKLSEGMVPSKVNEDDLRAIFRHALILNKAVELCLHDSGKKYNRSVSDTIGILSCIGMIILLSSKPDAFREIYETALRNGITFHEAENLMGIKEDLSLNITCHLLDLYNMPFDILEIIHYRNNLDSVSPENRFIACVLNAVSSVAARVRAGMESEPMPAVEGLSIQTMEKAERLITEAYYAYDNRF